jgi:hypothetical protein
MSTLDEGLIPLDEGLIPLDEVPTGPTRAHRTLAAVEGHIQLPAVVDRHLDIRSVGLPEAVRLLQAVIERCGALTVDVETSGYPVGHTHYRLRTVQLGDLATAVVFDATEATHASVIRTLLTQAPRLHAHSATADLVPLARAGLVDADSAWQRMHDTVIRAKLSNPASTGGDPGLKELAPAVLGSAALTSQTDAAREELFARGRWLTNTTVTTPIAKSGWAQVDPTWPTMIRYAASDVLDTAALAEKLPPVPPVVLARERAVLHLTARITHAGLPLDGDHVATLLSTYTLARGQAADRVRAHQVSNPGSDPQVGAALLAAGGEIPRTRRGAPSVSVGTLSPLRETP